MEIYLQGLKIQILLHSGIVIAGDTNAGWVGNDVGVTGEGIYYQSSNNLMRFYTNSAERIRILSDGKVGIGTSSPVDRLHISGGNILLNNALEKFAQKDTGGNIRNSSSSK